MDKLLFMLMAVTLLFSLAMQYYDSCHVEWFDHALTKSAVAGVSWIWLHLLLTFLLFLLGIFFRFQLESFHSTEYQFVLRLPGIMALISVALTAMRVCHTSIFSLSLPLKISYACRATLSLLQVLVRFIEFKSQTQILGVQLVICAMFNVVDIVVDLYKVELEKEMISSGSFKPTELPKQWANLQIYVTDKHTILAMGDDGDVLAAASGKFQSRRQTQDGNTKELGTGTGTTEFEVDIANSNNTNVVRNKITVNLADFFENARPEITKQDSRPHFFGDLHWQPIPSPSQSRQYSRSKIFAEGNSPSHSPALSRGPSMWDNGRSDRGVVLFKRTSNKQYSMRDLRHNEEVGLDGGNSSSRGGSHHSSSSGGSRMHKIFFERIDEKLQSLPMRTNENTNENENDFEYQDAAAASSVVTSDGILSMNDFKRGHLLVLENIQNSE